jgi:hypothetical protein
VCLTQGSEQGLETGAVEFRPRRARRVFGRRAVRHQLLPSILEVLRKFLDDLALARGREVQRYETRSEM